MPFSPVSRYILYYIALFERLLKLADRSEASVSVANTAASSQAARPPVVNADRPREVRLRGQAKLLDGRGRGRC